MRSSPAANDLRIIDGLEDVMRQHAQPSRQGQQLVEQSLVFGFGYAIETVCHGLQTGPVQHGDVAAARGDQSAGSEVAKRDRDTRPARAKHEGDEVVRKGEAVALRAILDHQQPPRQSFRDGAQSIRERRVLGLHGKDMDEATEDISQGRAFQHGRAELIGFNAQAMPGDLHHHVAG